MDSLDRELWLARRRAILTEAAAIEERLEIEKEVLYLPVSLHPADERRLTKHFKIVRGTRPSQ